MNSKFYLSTFKFKDVNIVSFVGGNSFRFFDNTIIFISAVQRVHITKLVRRVCQYSKGRLTLQAPNYKSNHSHIMLYSMSCTFHTHTE